MIGAIEIPPQTVAALFAANDIQAAAGPGAAAGGPAGGPGGGSGGNFQVPVGNIGDAFAIGGLLDPTALSFGNNQERPFFEGLVDEPTVGTNVAALLDDDDLTGGNAGGLGDDLSGPLTGLLAHDFGGNGVGALVFDRVDFPAGSGFSFSISDDGLVLTILQDGVDVMRVTLSDATSGEYQIEQLAAISHAGSNEDNVQFDIVYRVTDFDGDAAEGTLTVNIDDDTPEVALVTAPGVGEGSGVQLGLDETFGIKVGDANPAVDDANGAGFSSANLTTSLAEVGSKAFGQVATANGANNALAALFSATVSLGADAGTVAHAFALSLSGSGQGVSTNLTATGVAGTQLAGLSDRTIYLFSEADGSITGRVGGAGGFIAFHISLIDASDPTGVSLLVQQLIPLSHGDALSADDILNLALAGDDVLSLTYTVTATDGDGDVASATAQVPLASAGSGAISFEDDGPTLTVGVRTGEGVQAGLAMEIDETVGSDRLNGLGEFGDAGNNDDGIGYLGRATTTVGGAGLASLFAIGGSFGSDGGSDVSVLSFVGFPAQGGVATNLFATNGGPISLFLVDGFIQGRTAGGVVVFDIKIVDGQLQTTLYQAIEHTDNNLFDSNTALALGGENSPIQLQLTVTRTDGDGDKVTQSAQIDLITAGGSPISFDDDGPTLAVGVATGEGAQAGLTMELDETVGPDRLNGLGELADAGNNDDGIGYFGRSTTAIGGTGLASLFTVGGSFGSDGGGDVSVLSFVGFPLEGGIATNLSATNGGPITLFLVDGVIQGKTAGNAVVFDIKIVDGQLQTTLYQAIEHTDANLFDGNVTLSLGDKAAAIQLQLTVTRTDGDGDTVTQSAQIDLITANGSPISFDDDGPVANVAANSAFALTHDESLLAQTGTNDATVLQSIALAARFAGVALPGQDPSGVLGLPLGLAQSSVSAVTIAGLDFGSDGAATNQSLVYGFSLTNKAGEPSTGPLDSGLQTTEGKPIYLVLENGLIVGRVDDGASGQDPAAFALHMDPQTGQVTLIQYVSLAHGEPTNANELASLDEIAGALNATVTITDGDGDSKTISASIGNGIHFRDDAPTGFQATSFVVLDDEAQSLFPGNPGGSGDVFFNFATTAGLPGTLFYAGVDGVGSITLTAAPVFSVIYNLNGLAAQQTVNWNPGVANPDGSVTFTATGAVNGANAAVLTVGNDGSYVFTMLAPLAHPVGNAENNKTLAFGLTIVDGDGDTTQAGLSVSVDDDTPVGKSVTAPLTLDDEAQSLFAGNNTPADTIVNNSQVIGGAGTLFAAGADGLATIDLLGITQFSVIYKLGADGVPEAITSWVKSVDPQTGVTTFSAISAHYPINAPVATLVVQPNGAYTFTVNAPLVQLGTPTNEQADSLTLTLDLQVTDGDGDISPVKLTVKINDDRPTMAGEYAPQVVMVDEDGLNTALATGNPDGSPLLPGEVVGTGLATYTGAAGSLNNLVSFGADGKGSFSVVTTSPTNAGVTSLGANVLVAGGGDTLYGYVDSGVAGYQDGSDRLVFTLKVNSDGSYTFTLNDQIDHPTLNATNGDNAENLLNNLIDLSRFVQATDGDGDSIALGAGSFVVDVLDDIPVLTARPAGTTTTTTSDTLVFDLKGGNAVVGGVTTANPAKGIWITGDDLNGNDDTANTSNNSIGIGTGQQIDGQDKKGGPEVLTLSFFDNVNVPNGNGVPTHGAAYDVNVMRFSIDAAEAGQNDDAVVFVQVMNNGGVVSPGDFVITINGAAAPVGSWHYVYDGANMVGIVFENVPDDADFVITSATGFDSVKIGNYNGYKFISDAVGSDTTLSSGNSFKVYGLEADVHTTTTTLETLKIAHDETLGQNVAGDPNSANDASLLNVPGALAGATGVASLGTSVLATGSLFAGMVGADAPGGYTFGITGANGAALTNVASGLVSTSGEAIILNTDANGVLVGTTANTNLTVFKVLVDSAGIVWVGQYLPIAHSVDGSSNAAHDDIATITAILHITATLTDADGDAVSKTSPVALKVEFQDDGPRVAADVNSVTEDGAPATGNVIAGNAGLGTDTFGTDGPGKIEWVGDNGDHVIDGLYGRLTVQADGQYTYELYTVAQNPAAFHLVQSLTPTQSLSEQFTYVLTDGDGDTAQTTLTIAVNGADDIVTITGIGNTGGDVTVDEKGLPARGQEPAGSVPGDSEIGTGSFAIVAPDGVQSIKIGDTTFTLSNLASATPNAPLVAATNGSGILQVIGYTPNATGGTVNYRFVLTDNLLTHTDTDPGAPQGTDADSDRGPADQVFGGTFAVEVTDDNGTTATSSITVAVNDDGPTASAGSRIVDEGVTVTGTLAFTPGADGATLTAINGEPLIFGNDGWSAPMGSDHGTLQVKADGSYRFVAQQDDPYVSNGTDQFTFTVTDGDGDKSDALFQVTIVDDQDVVTVKLTATPSTGEQAGTIVYTASLVDALGHPVTTNNAVTVTLNSGLIITIPAGSNTADSAAVPFSEDDVYVEADTVSDFIRTAVQANANAVGAFEQLQADQTPAVTTIVDDQDVVTVKLTATPSTGEQAGTIVYTASLVDALGNPVTTNNAVTVTLNSGLIITIPAGSNTADSTAVPFSEDDVYVEADTVSDFIQTAVQANANAVGAFEQLQADQTPAVTTIVDDQDVVTVRSDGDAVDGRNRPARSSTTASLVDALGNPVTTNNAVTVTLNSGLIITIPAGSNTADSAAVPFSEDDVYVAADTVSDFIQTAVQANASRGCVRAAASRQTPAATIGWTTRMVTVKLTATPSTGEQARHDRLHGQPGGCPWQPR
ncbi:DUF5801 repeats-in-toxin domain-containing protein [Devosia sp. SL43]|uniref:DUF5801 repeats-in-toxin domain-containing protein n=1 Tax=Devosia sp. SL43 TaxID=2806348 RepID=UPI001F226A30|nr:DUF5801 repeats-in-toxin domain-containing protein [Devosia sp. SL43]UJW83980.1 hypothetical protein IM737_10960 [Devosia sp. SL43]